MTARPIMIQGTASNVGKSIIAAALCRIFHEDGFRVAPFKSQNMSNNSFVTREGGEMGRAQVTQAQAACIEPHVDMNPILLKPTNDFRSQVIVAGKPVGTMPWNEYRKMRDELLEAAMAAYQRLSAKHDIIVIEGAGSPAEVNLKDGDIVNMRIATLTKAPVYLVTDIDRGGALAWVVGTLSLLPPAELALIQGIIINKFRGDIQYLRPGLDFLAQRTNKPVAGVLPYLQHIGIDDEDSVSLDELGNGGVFRDKLQIAVIQLPTISNFTDFAPLAQAPDVSLRYVRLGAPIQPADCVIIPGSKNTLLDLKQMWDAGTASEIVRFAHNGGTVLGICGGYQMMGSEVSDPEASESSLGRVLGLNLLPVRTTLASAKMTYQVSGAATLFNGGASSTYPISGYEIHHGVTERLGGSTWLKLNRLNTDGFVDEGCFIENGSGFIAGAYVHGLFDSPGYCRAFLDYLRQLKSWPSLQVKPDAGADPYARLAEVVRAHLDIKGMYQAMGLNQ